MSAEENTANSDQPTGPSEAPGKTERTGPTEAGGQTGTLESSGPAETPEPARPTGGAAEPAAADGVAASASDQAATQIADQAADQAADQTPAQTPDQANAQTANWGDDPERQTGDGAADGGAANGGLKIDVEGFEGPLDLLLALARTQKIDLARISMVALVDQYLHFIAQLRKVRLEVAADYLVMAAWLAYLKSRLLLPKEEVAGDEASGEELAARLAFRLMRLEAMRKAGAQLMTRHRLDRDVFARGAPEGVKTIREREYTAQIYDLLKAYATQRQRSIKHKPHIVRARRVWSIKDARQRLVKMIGTSGNWVQLDMFLEQYMAQPEHGKTMLASSFGASLEMARDGLVELRQEKAFSPIYMRRLVEGAEWEKIGEG